MILQITLLIDTDKEPLPVLTAAVARLQKAGAKIREASISDEVEPERFDFSSGGGTIEPETVMPFGMYKGQPMEKVPQEYLDYLYNESWISIWPGVLAYIESVYHVEN